MTPEIKARQDIDRQLEQCGWLVQDSKEMNISAGPGVAVREVRLKPGPTDYLLYVDAKAIGIVEAKKEGHTLKGVEKQSMDYLNGLPNGFPHHVRPLPFHYESTGKVTQFTSLLDPDSRSREVFTFHRPEELPPPANCSPNSRPASTQTQEMRHLRRWEWSDGVSGSRIHRKIENYATCN